MSFNWTVSAWLSFSAASLLFTILSDSIHLDLVLILRVPVPWEFISLHMASSVADGEAGLLVAEVELVIVAGEASLGARRREFTDLLWFRVDISTDDNWHKAQFEITVKAGDSKRQQNF